MSAHPTRRETAGRVHYRLTYFRPSWQGGDVAHPLCQAPLYGWAGEDAARMPMVREPGWVTCPACLKGLSEGGGHGRHRRLAAYLFARGKGDDWRARIEP